MALRAGYYGLKNSVKRTLEKLASDMAGAKAIKNVGDGLSLSDQGALSANIDSDTMEFKNGKIASKSSSWNYSLSEVNTGQKWIDGKDIYLKTLYFENGVDIPASTGTITTTDDLSSIENVVDAIFIKPAAGTNPAYSGRGIVGITGATQITPRVITGLSGCKYIVIFYTKKD